MNNNALKLQALRRCVCLAFIMAGVGFALARAQAELLFSDSFDYPNGSLDGNGPPPGSPPGQGSWINLVRDAQVASPGLVFRGIQSVGNSASLGDDGTSFDGDITAADVTPIGRGVAWIGFLIQPRTKNTSYGYGTLTWNDGFGPTAPQFGVIFATGRYGIDNNVIPTEDALSDLKPQRAVVWMVVKLDFNTGNQFLFLNPPKGTEPPGSQANARLAMRPEFRASGFNRIVLREGRNSGTYSFDEIRVGTTFADLTP